MTDMLVRLYDNQMLNRAEELVGQGIEIKRAMAFDKQTIVQFVGDHFSDICPQWMAECELTLCQQPPTCFIAAKGKDIIGFCCWDASAKGMVGPIGVHADYRGKGIASELMRHSFEAMKSDGYAYAIIGWVSSEAFYEKVCNAIAIPDSFPGVYSRLLSPE